MKIKYLKNEKAVDRIAYILEQCDGSSILHLGCVDSPYLEERIMQGTLLHQKLLDVSNDVAGIDLDEEGILFMRQQLGINDLYLGNIEKVNELRINRKFDVVIAPEIIEHIHNPGLFLKNIKELIRVDGFLIVTVPNALNSKIFFHSLLNRENVHSDHNFYFTPTTLKRLIKTNGYEILDIRPYCCPPRKGLPGLFDKILVALRYFSPWISEGIIVRARVVTQ